MANKRKRKKVNVGKSKRQQISPLAVTSLLLLAGLALLALVSLAQTVKQKESLRYDSPAKVALSQGNILGEGDEKKTEERRDEKKTEERKNEETKKVEVKSGEDQKKREEQLKESQKAESSINSQTSSGGNNRRSVTPSPETKRQSEGNKQETETETADGQKIKTKIEDDGTTKIEIEHGDLKIKYEMKNGQMVQKIEDEEGNEVELNEKETKTLEDKLKNDLNDDDMFIASNTAQPTIVRNNIAATTEFPLSIDVGTNRLILTTPSGQKTVSILPDQAVKNLLATGLVNSISSTAKGATAEEAKNLNGVVELKVRNGEPVYDIEGTKQFKLFAIVPVDQPVRAIISAETGKVLATQKSFLANFIDLLSP